jgi:hypothetical protein
MTPDGLTHDELIEAMNSLGNYPVVWLGTGLVKDAVGGVVTVYQDGKPLIGLQLAKTQTNIGDVPTTSQVHEAREKLREAKNRFANSYELHLAGEIIKRDFTLIKNEYDAMIDGVLDLLHKF